MEPLILPSARRHGLPDDDMLHAYFHPFRVFQLDDLVMLIGPSTSGALIEIGISASADRDVIVHAMSARSKFTR